MLQCDGGKPACYTCLKKNQECVYEQPNAKEPKNGDLLVAAAQLLTSLTASQATETLLSLGSQQNASNKITLIRQVADRAAQSPDRSSSASSTFARELETTHPFAYPVIRPLDASGLTDLLEGAESPGVAPGQTLLFVSKDLPLPPFSHRLGGC